MENLTLPVIPVGETYYYPQSNVKVFRVNKIKGNRAKIYLTHEGKTRKRTNDIWSFLLDYLNNNTIADLEKLHIYLENLSR